MPPWQLAHVGLDNPLSYIPPRPLPIDTTLTASVPRCVLDPPPLRKSTRVSPHRPAVFDSDSLWWTFFSSSSESALHQLYPVQKSREMSKQTLR